MKYNVTQDKLLNYYFLALSQWLIICEKNRVLKLIKTILTLETNIFYHEWFD